MVLDLINGAPRHPAGCPTTSAPICTRRRGPEVVCSATRVEALIVEAGGSVWLPRGNVANLMPDERQRLKRGDARHGGARRPAAGCCRSALASWDVRPGRRHAARAQRGWRRPAVCAGVQQFLDCGRGASAHPSAAERRRGGHSPGAVRMGSGHAACRSNSATTYEPAAWDRADSGRGRLPSCRWPVLDAGVEMLDRVHLRLGRAQFIALGWAVPATRGAGAVAGPCASPGVTRLNCSELWQPWSTDAQWDANAIVQALDRGRRSTSPTSGPWTAAALPLCPARRFARRRRGVRRHRVAARRS